MMRTFRNQQVVPPGGRYFFEVPETRVYFSSTSLSGLETLLRAHYGANKLPVPPDLRAQVADFICRRVPAGFCEGGGPDVKVLTLADVRARTEAVVQRPLVMPGMAAQRARLCGACPQNDRTLCPTCVGLVAWALQLVGRPQEGIHAWLGVCTLDGAALAAKIYALDVVAPEAEAVPETCWMLRVEKRSEVMA